MSCEHPLDPLDLEALASGEAAPGSPEALTHAEECADCRRRLEAFREVGLWLAEPPGTDAGPDLSSRIERLRGFTRREKRSAGLWWPPAALFFGFLAGSAALLSVPILSGPEQAGILSALPAALGLEWKTILALPSSVGRALPASVAAIADVLALERGYAAISILLLLPAGFSIGRLWLRRSASR
ncbi:MAG: hypothetical protein ACRD16_04745 [Thermoanaerobaculia bacterium]